MKKNNIYAVIAGAFLISAVSIVGCGAFPDRVFANDSASANASTGEEITKNLSLELTKEYEECIFTVTFEGGFLPDKIELTSPKGKISEFTIDSVSGQYSCKVNDAEQGTWSATIYKNFPEDSSSFEIPKATFAAKTSETKSQDVTGSIDIAKEITGLKYYWKDDDIVVEWDDESVGNVVVQTINSKTLQVLDKQTVDEQIYEYTVDSSVNEIILNIVPATSSGIGGADTQYVVKNDYKPDASIKFDEAEYINQDSISAVATLNGNYTLIYYDNGNEVGNCTDLSTGDNDIKVPLTEGRNELLVYVVDENGNMKSFPKNIIMDTVPPVLKVSEDINGTSTYDASVVVKGNVSDFDTLTHGTREIDVDDLGDFEATIDIKEGENNVVLTATDVAGNVTEYNAKVTMLVKEPFTIPVIPIIIGIVFLVIIVAIVFFKKKQSKPKAKKKKKVVNDDKYESDENDAINKSDIFQIASLIITFALAMFLVLFVFQITRVQSGSMEPTVMTGDVGVVNKLAYFKNSPQRGDIIIIDSKEKGVMLLKRIIGMPGDKIEFHNGYVYINGTICDESAYLDSEVETNSNTSFEVPDNCYFVMGDNREDSNDSRYWEQPYISIRDIKGELLLHSDALTIIEKEINKLAN